jgi:hypothetical protein
VRILSVVVRIGISTDPIFGSFSRLRADYRHSEKPIDFYTNPFNPLAFGGICDG